MKKDNLFDLLQNSVISAISLHAFAYGYHNVAKRKPDRLPFPSMVYTFYVLPIVFHYDTMDTFRSSNELYTVLIKNSSVVLGLGDRANKLATKTFEGLNLAFSKKILSYDADQKTITVEKGFTTKKLVLPLTMSSTENSVKKMQDCAFKLGAIFAKRDANVIQAELNIRF